MGRIALIVHSFSYHYVRHSVDYIHAALERSFGACDLLLCETPDEASYADGATVFVIGENLRPLTRRPGCYYVYLNFSVVALMGNPLNNSFDGLKAIWRKRRLMNLKLDRFDMLLDYYAPQAERLARQLKMPVRWFPSATPLAYTPPSVPLDARTYDVCFVGAVTPRRARVLEALRAAGWSVSPLSGVIYEEAAAQSRVSLNVHANRSNHLETPRILGAMAVRAGVVTEHCFGLQDIAPDGTVIASDISGVVDALSDLLRAPDALAAQIARATDWYENTLLPRYADQWDALAHEIDTLRTKGESAPVANGVATAVRS